MLPNLQVPSALNTPAYLQQVLGNSYPVVISFGEL